MKIYRAELHLHTVLSPCASVEMIPPLIVQEAIDRGIHIIAITDHNTTSNVIAVQKAAKGTDLAVIPGMELQTREDVHILCLFEDLEQMAVWQDFVNRALPDLANNPAYFGEQYIVDESGELIRREERMLLTSTKISFNEAVDFVTKLGGLAIPAHVNRKVNSVFANLGFIPTDIHLEAVEISRHITPDFAIKTYPQLQSYPLIQNGDAHFLSDLLGVNEFFLKAPTLTELRFGLGQQEGRNHKILVN